MAISSCPLCGEPHRFEREEELREVIVEEAKI
jgi:hypothetical protein